MTRTNPSAAARSKRCAERGWGSERPKGICHFRIAAYSRWARICLLPMAVLLISAGCEPDGMAPSAGPDVRTTLGGEQSQGYAVALKPRAFDFPADHGPHPDFRNEWWYWTGNLTSTAGQDFGYQLTVFRTAVSPHDADTGSAWRTRQVYMAHFAISDITNKRHRSFERFARGALGLADARASPFRVWVEDWQIEGAADTTFPLRLRATQEAVSLDLELSPTHGPILQGNAGLSAKGDEPGNASYYYSYTRMDTRGSITIDGEKYDVTGLSWFDREWSTSALGPNRTGWDWFALQLNDGRDLMFYRLRLSQGGMAPESAGVLVQADGSYRALAEGDVELEPIAHWVSPETGDRYPIEWRLRLPEEGLDLTIESRFDDQEMRLTFGYWEGAVKVSGSATGLGYLEMTRYTDAAPD